MNSIGRSPRAALALTVERLGASRDWREIGHLRTVSPSSVTQKNWNLLWRQTETYSMSGVTQWNKKVTMTGTKCVVKSQRRNVRKRGSFMKSGEVTGSTSKSEDCSYLHYNIQPREHRLFHS